MRNPEIWRKKGESYRQYQLRLRALRIANKKAIQNDINRRKE